MRDGSRQAGGQRATLSPERPLGNSGDFPTFAAHGPFLTEDQSRIEEAVGAICDRFDDNFWLERDRDGGFPFEFHAAMAEGGWLGIAMPRPRAAQISALPRRR